MIKVQTENSEASFRPGEVISGSVQWNEEEGDTMEVRLIWYTRGKGDRDFELVATHTVSAFGPAGSERFEFMAPNRPQSFSGKLIFLQWALEAIVFPGQNSDRLDLTISNTGNEIDLLPPHPLD